MFRLERVLCRPKEAFSIGLGTGLVLTLELCRWYVFRIELPAQIPNLLACAYQAGELLREKTLKPVRLCDQRIGVSLNQNRTRASHDPGQGHGMDQVAYPAAMGRVHRYWKAGKLVMERGNAAKV
jgi:hypothetical protein